jgi:hypothetical protein
MSMLAISAEAQTRGITQCDLFYLQIDAFISKGNTLSEKQKADLQTCLRIDKEVEQMIKDRDKARSSPATKPEQHSK